MPAEVATPETVETTQPIALHMSYDEWFAWNHEGGLTEWVDGEVIVMPPPSTKHQSIVVFLVTLLNMFVQLHRLGRVLAAPVSLRVTENGNVREPGVLFLASEHDDRFTPRGVVGPADLVIEIISNESAARDRTDKFYEYQVGGVREYWLIDPRDGKQRVDLYVLDAGGRYQPVLATDGAYHSAVLPGFWLREEWLWAEQPNALVALASVVGPEQFIAAMQRA